MTADLLSEAFRLMRLTGALMFRFDVYGRWHIANAATSAPALARLLPPGTDQIIVLHIVNKGECWMRHQSGDWVQTREGDAVVLAHGHAHDIANSPEAAPIPFREVLGPRSFTSLHRLRYEQSAEPEVQIVCGFLGCSRRAFTPLCASLPQFCKVTFGEPARSLLHYAISETLDERPGAETVRIRMAELLFLEALRLHMTSMPDDATGWLAGLRDPLVARAMRALHADPSKPWSVHALAAATDSSRSRLAERFRAVMGEAPIHYLTRLRMQQAASSLSERALSVDRVASEVGYRSSAAFQRAFKRWYGTPPATWRRTVMEGSNDTLPL